MKSLPYNVGETELTFKEQPFGLLCTDFMHLEFAFVIFGENKLL